MNPVSEAEITTLQAAELLNVSQPYVAGMIRKGTLSARMVGSEYRLMLKDVLAYKAENGAKRLKVLDELTALDQDLGLFDLTAMPAAPHRETEIEPGRARSPVGEIAVTETGGEPDLENDA